MPETDFFTATTAGVFDEVVLITDVEVEVDGDFEVEELFFIERLEKDCSSSVVAVVVVVLILVGVVDGNGDVGDGTDDDGDAGEV